MDRDLTDWERAVLRALASPDLEVGEDVRQSLPHLVVTGGCVWVWVCILQRDGRPVSSATARVVAIFEWRQCEPECRFVLWLGPDGRPISVDVENEPGVLPDPSRIVVTAPGPP